MAEVRMSMYTFMLEYNVLRMLGYTPFEAAKGVKMRLKNIRPYTVHLLLDRQRRRVS